LPRLIEYFGRQSEEILFGWLKTHLNSFLPKVLWNQN
jgi:hypothetical protein